MDKKDIKRGLVGAIIVAELAVLDYCAIQLMNNGLEVEVTQAGEQAIDDMNNNERSN